jgi:hypothetical protein
MVKDGAMVEICVIVLDEYVYLWCCGIASQECEAMPARTVNAIYSQAQRWPQTEDFIAEKKHGLLQIPVDEAADATEAKSHAGNIYRGPTLVAYGGDSFRFKSRATRPNNLLCPAAKCCKHHTSNSPSNTDWRL